MTVAGDVLGWDRIVRLLGRGLLEGGEAECAALELLARAAVADVAVAGEVGLSALAAARSRQLASLLGRSGDSPLVDEVWSVVYGAAGRMAFEHLEVVQADGTRVAGRHGWWQAARHCRAAGHDPAGGYLDVWLRADGSERRADITAGIVHLSHRPSADGPGPSWPDGCVPGQHQYVDAVWLDGWAHARTLIAVNETMTPEAARHFVAEAAAGRWVSGLRAATALAALGFEIGWAAPDGVGHGLLVKAVTVTRDGHPGEVVMGAHQPGSQARPATTDVRLSYHEALGAVG